MGFKGALVSSLFPLALSVASACLERGFDYDAGDVHDLRHVGSAEQCRRLCANYPGCKYFTFVASSSGGCWLKDGSAKSKRRRNDQA